MDSLKKQKVSQRVRPIIACCACLLLLVGSFTLTACNPTVKVEAPDKPIEINMNINIKHEILVKIDKQVEEILNDDELF